MELKDRIIGAAYELFSTKGYEKTTIEAIIKEAQCAKGGFYHHFKSKEEILGVIVTNYIDDLSRQYDSIVSNSKSSFIDKFNDVFAVISQYKLKQLMEWSKVNNIFSFAGNDRILRLLEQQFKRATSGTYLKVLEYGMEQANINSKNLKLLSELCTREVLWIFEAAGKLVNPDNAKDYDDFEAVLAFSEEIISYALGLPENVVKFKDVGFSYLRQAREFYLENKEGLR